MTSITHKLVLVADLVTTSIRVDNARLTRELTYVEHDNQVLKMEALQCAEEISVLQSRVADLEQGLEYWMNRYDRLARAADSVAARAMNMEAALLDCTCRPDDVEEDLQTLLLRLGEEFESDSEMEVIDLTTP